MEVDAVRVAGRGEIRARAFRELGDPLDRVYLAGELGEHRRLVARAGADVEHTLARRAKRAVFLPGAVGFADGASSTTP